MSLHRFTLMLSTVVSVLAIVRSDSCPAWFYYNNESQQCECPQLKRWGIRCNTQEMKFEVANGYCVSYLNDVFYSGDCEYGHTGNFTDRLFSVMPTDPNQLNQAMCGSYKRKGLLCSECICGYGPAIYSLDNRCTDCSRIPTVLTVLLYILLEFIPILVFFILLSVFRVNITQGPLLGYVFFCQLYVLSIRTKNNFLISTTLSDQSFTVQLLIYGSFVLAGIWSLKFSWIIFPNFCLSRHLTGIHVLLLELVPPIITIIIMTQTSIFIDLHKRNCRPIVKIWKIVGVCLKTLRLKPLDGTAVINTFATFIFLFGYNLNYVLIEMVIHYSVSESNGSSYRYVVANDPSIVWLSPTHIAYVSVVWVSFLFLVILPALLLCLYPTRLYHSLSRFISARRQLAVKTFAEALHQCFKDGLDGTNDYRSLAGATLVVGATSALVTFSVYTLTNTGYDYKSFSGLVFIVFSSVFAYLRPCKHVITDLSFSYHTMVLGLLSMALNLWRKALSFDTATLELIFIVVPVISHVSIITWAGYLIVKRIRHCCENSSSLNI